MFGSKETQGRVLVAVAASAAGAIQVSISVSQILLGLGIILAILFRQKLQFPRIWIPLSALFVWTALAVAVSPDPWTGRAQLKKFVIFLFIPLLYGAFARRFSKTFYVVIAWTITAAASGLLGLEQFAAKYERAQKTGEDFYVTYVGHRITGFESHWMTFGALQLSVLSLVLAQLFFSDRRLPGWVAYPAIAVFSVTILLGETRSIWLATIPAVLYLVWCWRPKMTLALPFLVAAAFTVAPATTRERLSSLISPHGETDSNRHRIVTFRTGLEMIKAHPWFGIGPEEIGRKFDAYVPSDIKRPLPVGYYGHLHNIYLQYAAERGLPGLAFMLWFIGMTLWDCVRAIRLTPKGGSEQLFLLHGTVAVILGVLVGGLFEYNLGDSEVLMMFVCVIALGYTAAFNVNAVGAYKSKRV